MVRGAYRSAMTTLWFETAFLPTGWADRVSISIADGRIASVTSDSDPAPDAERHAIGLPGSCNVHSHGFQRGMAGLSEHHGEATTAPSSPQAHPDNFWSWREVMYRFLDRLTPEDVHAITAQAYAEMLEGGYTRVGEFHYVHNAPDGSAYDDPAELAGAVAAAAAESGIGLTLLPVFYAHSDFGGQPPSHGQRRFIKDLDGFAALLDACRKHLSRDDSMGVAPHSLRAVTEDELAALLQMSPTGPVHIHAAEQVREVEASVAHSGQRPVEWLLDHVGVDERWCLIHATHLTEDETDRLAASGAVAGLCPITEANLGDGIFPAERYLGAGGAIGTGTDSNILISVAGELRSLEYSQRLIHRARNVLASDTQSTGARLFGAAVAGGAQALGVQGGITVDTSADLISLDANHASIGGRNGDAIIDSWLFASPTSPIDSVWRAGQRVVTEGRHFARDTIATRYCAVLDKILA